MAVAGEEARDDDLNAFFVLAAVGTNTDIAGHSLVDAAFGLAHPLRCLVAEVFRSQHVDELDAGSEADPQAHGPRHRPAGGVQLAIHELDGILGGSQHPPMALAQKRQPIDGDEIRAAAHRDDTHADACHGILVGHAFQGLALLGEWRRRHQQHETRAQRRRSIVTLAHVLGRRMHGGRQVKSWCPGVAGDREQGLHGDANRSVAEVLRRHQQSAGMTGDSDGKAIPGLARSGECRHQRAQLCPGGIVHGPAQIQYHTHVHVRAKAAALLRPL